jgi:hypothetical protein
VVVELEGVRPTVRLRPAVLVRLIGVRSLNVTAGDGLQVFAVRSNATYQGIEFRPAQKSSFYFFTRRRWEVLAALANAGFPISQDPGREGPVWYQPADE